MLTLFRWLLRLTVALIVLAGLALGLIWYFAVRSLPDYAATETIAGLAAPVEIIRTTNAVPHIMAENDRDAFLALGYAHAQDRLFQMTVLRRAAQGRLSELYGARTLAADDLARRLDLAGRAQASLAALDPETRELLAAYATGVNRWIEVVNRDALGRGAPEFFLLPDTIAYWRPEDSLAILKLWALSSTRALQDEVDAARLSLALPGPGPQIVARPGTPPLRDYAALFAGARFAPPEGAPAPTDQWPDRLAGYLYPGAASGGGVWAVAPSHTAAGGAILASDPQGALSAPGLYYLARVELRAGGVIGATIPGIPAVFAGRSAALAWGMTPSGADDQDLFIEEVQPGAPDRYRDAQGWRDFDMRSETIRVRDGEARRITLRQTVNGPVLPGAHFGISDVVPQGHVAALGWPGLAMDDTSIAGLIGLMRAPDRAAGQRAAGLIVAPAMWLVLADRDGVSGQQTGRLPERGGARDGRLPAPGWQAAARWQGWAAPHLPVDGGTSGLVSAVSGPGAAGGRPQQQRLARLAGGREIHSRDSVMEEQLDIVSQAARQLLPVVGADLWFTGEPAASGTPERQRQDALVLLAAWDGRMSEHLPEPLIYAAWMGELQQRLIRDELGPLAARFTALRPDFIEAVFRDTGGAAVWCDIVQSAPVEDCTTIARQSLDAAILDLTERLGPQVSSWRWGDLHQAVHAHPALGTQPGAGWLANLRQSVSGGDFTLAQAGLLGGEGRGKWQAVTGAGYRGIYDLADPDASVFVIATGQSGHVLSRHYDDLGELWRRGEYIRMSLDTDLARAGATGVTRLLPAP